MAETATTEQIVDYSLPGWTMLAGGGGAQIISSAAADRQPVG